MKTPPIRYAIPLITIPQGATRTASFTLNVPRDERRSLALGWLTLGVVALVAAGAFSLVLVLARVPYLGAHLPFANTFHTALVVHVDLSVLVWFAAMAAMLWTLSGGRRGLAFGWSALALAGVGTAFMIAAPFMMGSAPIMANYIPVLNQPVFLYGLAVFGLAFAIVTVRVLAASLLVPPRRDGPDALRAGLDAAAIAALIALGAFAWSWLEVPAHLTGKAYYEMLFWGGGHVLQFTWTLMMLVAWLWLASLVGARMPISARMASLMFAIGIATVLIAPVIYLQWPVASIEHNRMFTWLMRFGGGLAILPIALAVTIGLLRAPPTRPDRRPLLAALLSSMTLFAAGGVIGFMIHGNDVRIPAHYHGAIVGVTLALMGLAYALLEPFGFARPPLRLATWQPILYGGGQLLHIIGLVWSGGYGVQRKVAGTDQVLRTTGEVLGMGLMGLGGLIAIVGGLLFIVAIVLALRRNPPRQGKDPSCAH
jgi:cytochrome c oxidase subunit I